MPKEMEVPKTPCFVGYIMLHLPLSHAYPNIIPDCVLSCGLGATREGGAKLGDPGSAATWEPMMASGEKGKMMVNRSTSGWTNFWVPYFRPKKTYTQE